MVIKNPEEVNAVIVNGKQSKEYFHRVTGHAGHHLMDATAKYYKFELTDKVNNCLSCSLEKTRRKNVPKKNEDNSKNPGESMYLQQNGVVERAFVTVMERARAIMNHAGFTMAKRQQLWCEATQTATMLDNILVQESAKSPPFTQFLE